MGEKYKNVSEIIKKTQHLPSKQAETSFKETRKLKTKELRQASISPLPITVSLKTAGENAKLLWEDEIK